MRASGVATVTASTFEPKMESAVPGATHVAMMTGQENRNARAASAGFIKFCPMPPKSCLTTMIAKKSPMMSVQYGMVTGHTNASSNPVTTADRSPAVQSFFMSLR